MEWPVGCHVIERLDLENDPRFGSMEARAQNCEDLIRILDQIFAMVSLREWEERLREHKCIYARIQTPDEVINDPQAIANNFFAEIEHPVTGRTRLVTTPVRFPRNPASVKTAAPEVGQNTEEVLLGLGYTWDDIAQLKDKRVIL